MRSEILLAAAALVPTASTVPAEHCSAAWTDAAGEPQSTPIVLDLGSAAELDPAALPERTLAIACPRPSIVPSAGDVRVLVELGVSLGIIDGSGRGLWVWARDGRLQTTVDNGELSSAEAAALDSWFVDAQARFEAALARH